MKKMIVSSAFALAAASTVGVAASSSQAATTSVDLAMTGSVVAGVKSAQPGQEVPFLFTMKNNSTTSSATADFVFTVTNGSADVSDYVCPLISTHYNINPDTSACEPGVLGVGKATQAAILVTAKATGTTTVKACVHNESATPDPVTSNNCKTLSLPIS